MSAKFLIIPEAALDDVRTLCGLTPEQLQSLAEALADKTSVSSEEPVYQLVAERLGLGYEQALGVLSVVRNLRRQRERHHLNPDQVLADLKLLLKEEERPDDSQSLSLLRLLEKTEEDQFVEKLGSLKQALIPHLMEATTIVDLRPVFSADRKAVDGLLLVSYLELSTHDHSTDEYKQVRVRLSRKDIDLLLSKLTDAKVKLERLEATFKDHDIYE